MCVDTIINKIKNIISDYVGISQSEIDESMSLCGDMSIDSFSLISLISSLEEEFDITIKQYELVKIITLSDLITLIDLKVNDNSPEYQAKKYA